MHSLRAVVLIALVFAAFTATCLGQTGQVGHSSLYSNGRSPFTNPIAPFKPISVPKPNYVNSPRINQLIQDGKLKLSMDDAVALVLENNLDLAIFRYNLGIADTDVLRTKAGAAFQGVSVGVVQGTPGGGSISGAGASGGGPGGTSIAAGGAGSGAGGTVFTSLGAGPPVDTFDPVLSGTLSVNHATTPLTSNFVTGTFSSQQNTGLGNFQYSQAFPTGTSLAVGFNNQRVSNNNVRNVLNPTINSNAFISFRQHLLQGLSIATNKRFMLIARNNVAITDAAFKLQVTSTVTQIQNLYWTLVAAYEDVRAKQRALDLANRLLADNQKQVQIGTLAPIEVVRAQSQVSSSSQDLIVSQTSLQLQQLLMKNALSRNLTDPQLMAADVVPTDTMQLPATENLPPLDQLIDTAFKNRAELVETDLNLKNEEISNRAIKNLLLPSLDLVGSFGTLGLAGPLTATAGGLPPGFGNTGLTDAFASVFGGDNPNYTIGLNLTIPIRNRTAQAQQIRSQLEYRQAQMRLQQQQNVIRIEVRNAQNLVQQDRARVDAATKGRQLAYETMDAEQKKYALGASTTYNVLQTQQALALAESNLINAMAAYESAKVELDRATGLTLTNLGIDLADAQNANVTKTPHVPNTVPSSSVINLTPQQATPPPQPQP
jgi:outer membrane protein TolC